MAILTSSAAGENSQESDVLRGSFFSHHLVAGLRGGGAGIGRTERVEFSFGGQSFEVEAEG